MTQMTTIGLDLAKSVFQVHGIDERGKVRVRKQLRRKEVLGFFSQLAPCLVGLEACGSAHYWARELEALGHTVKLISPQFVKPYVKSNKNDARDAEAICEAVTRPSMRFVPIKTPEQQAILSCHRARQGAVKARTAQANQLRGLLAEFGIVIPQGRQRLMAAVPTILAEPGEQLPGPVRHLFTTLFGQLQAFDRQIEELEQQINQWHRTNEASQRLEQVPGIGPLTASALVASIGDASAFQNGRQLAAWLGLVPRQHSTGGKPQLLGISKRGDAYLRTLLIHGARAVLRHTEAKRRGSPWLEKLLLRRHRNIAAVALAHKHARIVWALLAYDREYDPAWGPELA